MSETIYCTKCGSSTNTLVYQCWKCNEKKEIAALKAEVGLAEKVIGWRNEEIAALKAENEKLKKAISDAAVESMVEGQGQFCRYCLETLDEYYQGHKPDCIYLICSNTEKRP